MFQRNAWAVIGFLGFTALGCSKETTSSSNIRTGGIAALIDVYADTASTATVHVELKVGGSSSNTFVALENGDKLTATAGDQTKTLTVSGETGEYEAPFTGVGADTEFSVSLVRPTDETADRNSGTLPTPFEIDRPAPGKSRKTDDLEVTWAPSGSNDGMDFDFSGPCIFDLSKSPSDTGRYVVPNDTLQSTDGDKPETCDIKLAIQRSRAGVADDAFDPESYMRLHQRRSTTFSSAP